MAITFHGNGQVIKQVVQVVKTNVFSVSSTSFTDVTGLSVSITPTNSSNKILVICDVAVSAATNTGVAARLLRNGVPIYTGDAAGSRPLGIAGVDNLPYVMARTGGTYLDSPATTSTVTYNIQILNTTGGASYVNQTAGDRNTATYDARVGSSITLMEVAYA